MTTSSFKILLCSYFSAILATSLVWLIFFLPNNPSPKKFQLHDVFNERNLFCRIRLPPSLRNKSRHFVWPSSPLHYVLSSQPIPDVRFEKPYDTAM